MTLALDQNAAGRPAIRFAGLRITPMDVGQTVAALAGRDPAAAFTSYVTPNMEHIYFRSLSEAHAAALDAGFISTNDSRILRHAAHLAGVELDFAPGAHVVEALFDHVIGQHDRLSLIGGSPELAARVQARFGLAEMAVHVPPMGFIHDEAAIRAAVDFIVAHPSRFVFVAMGPPHSEQLCKRVMEDGRATGVGLCIGSSLVVLTGDSDPAPAWMERASLVWLYRLIREPRRLWRRYLVRGVYGLGVCLADIVAIRLGRRAVA